MIASIFVLSGPAMATFFMNINWVMMFSLRLSVMPMDQRGGLVVEKQ